ncbi:hypothetical protein GGP72_003319 [Salinibacter ruber]|uniref:Uncharacterized protein n=1 Tax=Salinibacter ruber TaxID=146919 RepID=A0A9X2THL0_9BACT|nr:hypothetical protein [Salinibacter ruber]MCS3682655.1 hypothetical protein [Salinibacter ruber]
MRNAIGTWSDCSMRRGLPASGHELPNDQAPHDRRRAPIMDYRCRECGAVFNIFTDTVWSKTRYDCSSTRDASPRNCEGDSNVAPDRQDGTKLCLRIVGSDIWPRRSILALPSSCCFVVGGFLFKSGRNPPALLQAAHAPFDDVAISVFFLIAGRRSSRFDVHSVSDRNDRLDIFLPAPPSVLFRVVVPVSLGCPVGLGTQTWSIALAKKTDSWRCPAVRRAGIGSPLLSVIGGARVGEAPPAVSECRTYSAIFSGGSVPFFHRSGRWLPSDSPELSCYPHPTAPSRFDPLRRALPESCGQLTAASHLWLTDEICCGTSSMTHIALENLVRVLPSHLT